MIRRFRIPTLSFALRQIIMKIFGLMPNEEKTSNSHTSRTKCNFSPSRKNRFTKVKYPTFTSFSIVKLIYFDAQKCIVSIYFADILFKYSMLNLSMLRITLHICVACSNRENAIENSFQEKKKLNCTSLKYFLQTRCLNTAHQT